MDNITTSIKGYSERGKNTFLCYWKDIKKFFEGEKINAKKVLEVFKYNDGQIFVENK